MLRSSSVVVLMFALCAPAWAGRRGGDDGGGGGRLGTVTSGLGDSKSSPSSSSSSDSGSRSSGSSTTSDTRSDSSSSTSYTYGGDGYVGSSTDRMPVWPTIVWPRMTVNGYAGAQKVVESDGSISAELSLVLGGKFRLNAAATRYFEDEMSITLTAPSLTAGVLVSPSPSTRLWIEGGVVHLSTKNPGSDAIGIWGSLANLRLEHDLQKNVALVGSAGAMLFSETQAFTGRASVRVHHVELGVRYLKFVDLPALYGPEVGIGF